MRQVEEYDDVPPNVREATLKPVLEKYPNLPHALLLQGRILMELGRYTDYLFFNLSIYISFYLSIYLSPIYRNLICSYYIWYRNEEAEVTLLKGTPEQNNEYNDIDVQTRIYSQLALCTKVKNKDLEYYRKAAELNGNIKSAFLAKYSLFKAQPK